jgi:hypothetical protein
MSPTRRALRDDLTRLGSHPIPEPSVAFTARLERQLIATVEPRPEAGATRTSPARHALRDDLTRLGSHPVPEPSVAFKARLERQLVGTVEPLPAAGATLLALPGRHRRLVPTISAAAAVVAAVVLTGALLGAFGHGGTGNLQLANARDTTVVLPGGHRVTGRTGLGLPNGTVVRTGPNGRAAAGPVELGPGLQGVVTDNHLMLQPVTPSLPNLPSGTPTIPPVPKVTPPTLPSVAPTLPLGLGH